MSPVSGRKAILPHANEQERGAKGSQYELLVKIASGGMATVYVGRRREGDGRLWAIKRAHAHLLERGEARRMFIEEAHIASRIRHPNIVTVEGIEDLEGELRLVMEYVEGGTLSDLVGHEEPLAPELAIRIALDASAGLHAAHGLTADDGTPLGLVHRDVSPHNILVGIDGIARLSDFGIAKNIQSSNSTTTGALKGKLAYMSPEYIEGAKADTRHDVFALGVVVWEMLANRRLFRGSNEVETMKLVTAAEVPALSRVAPRMGRDFDEILGMALARRPHDRFENAQAFGAAIAVAAERAGLHATHAEVGRHLEQVLAERLQARRAEIVSHIVPSVGDGKASTAKMGGASPPAALPGSGATLPLAGRAIPQTLIIDSQVPTHRLAVPAVHDDAATGEPRMDSLPIDTMRSREPTFPPTPEPPAHVSILDATTAIESSDPEPAGVPPPSRALAWFVTAILGLTAGGGVTFLLFGGDETAPTPSAPDAPVNREASDARPGLAPPAVTTQASASAAASGSSPPIRPPPGTAPSVGPPSGVEAPGSLPPPGKGLPPPSAPSSPTIAPNPYP